MEERLRRLENNQHMILRALHYIIGRLEYMGQIHDDIAAALSANETVTSDIGGKVTKLAAMKDESDSAFQDILSTVKAQNAELVKTNDALDAALADAQPSTGTTGQAQAMVSDAPSAATEVETEH